jgi:hypothetical protein
VAEPHELVVPGPQSPAARLTPTSATPALLDTLITLAATDRAADVARIAVAGARLLTGARAAALGELAPSGGAVELLASNGYDCESMSPGARLPLDSGLPIAEAVRTRRVVVTHDQGRPEWVAVPVRINDREYGALLVSLAGGEPEVPALEVLAAAVGGALDRARRADRLAERTGALVTALVPPPLETPAWLDAAAQLHPSDGEVGGDILLVFPDGPDACWLVVADVCGNGAQAAVLGAALRPIAAAACRSADTPAELLEHLDAVLARDADLGRFVTAVAVRLERTPERVRGTLAVAGHPTPLLCNEGGVVGLGKPSIPLNLRLGSPAAGPRDVNFVLGPDDALLLYTDGLVDRLGVGDGEDVLVSLFARARELRDAAATSEVLLGALDATTGPARDDLALLVVRPAPGVHATAQARTPPAADR